MLDAQFEKMMESYDRLWVRIFEGPGNNDLVLAHFAELTGEQMMRVVKRLKWMAEVQMEQEREMDSVTDDDEDFERIAEDPNSCVDY